MLPHVRTRQSDPDLGRHTPTAQASDRFCLGGRCATRHAEREAVTDPAICVLSAAAVVGAAVGYGRPAEHPLPRQHPPWSRAHVIQLCAYRLARPRQGQRDFQFHLLGYSGVRPFVEVQARRLLKIRRSSDGPELSPTARVLRAPRGPFTPSLARLAAPRHVAGGGCAFGAGQPIAREWSCYRKASVEVGDVLDFDDVAPSVRGAAVDVDEPVLQGELPRGEESLVPPGEVGAAKSGCRQRRNQRRVMHGESPDWNVLFCR